jgi:hypothetical protein
VALNPVEVTMRRDAFSMSLAGSLRVSNGVVTLILTSNDSILVSRCKSSTISQITLVRQRLDLPDIRTRLCSQWHACEQVKRYEDEMALTMAIGYVLMALSSTLLVATLAVLVVSYCGVWLGEHMTKTARRRVLIGIVLVIAVIGVAAMWQTST